MPESYRPNYSSRPRENSHRPRDHRDRRSESPRHRDREDRPSEPRRYRDRYEPGTRRHRREHQQYKQDQGIENKPPPKPRLYTNEERKRDNLAARKVHNSFPRTLSAAERASSKPRKDLPPANELKTKIRDVKRLLSRAEERGMPAGLKIEKERALKGYQADLEEVEERKKKSEMISKYHFVRFLERKRATSHLTRSLHHLHTLQTTKTPSPTHTSDLQSAQSAVHTSRVSLNYTIYHPLTEKYISLYPNTQKDKKKEEYLDSHPDSWMMRNSSGERPPIWGLVERCMVEGESEGEEGVRRRLEELRDGKGVGVGFGGASGEGSADVDADEGAEGKWKGKGGMSLPVVGGKKPGSFGVGSGSKTEVNKNKKTKEKKNDAGGDVEMRDDGEESDGGFFE